MRMRWTAAAAVALTLAAFGSPFGTAAGAKTLVYCSEATPDSLNPQYSTSATSYDVAAHIYDLLLSYKRGSMELEPRLAERWEATQDLRTYTLYLRRGVTFHTTRTFKPTREMNADDVVFSFQRQMDKTHPYHSVGGGKFYPPFNNLGLAQNLERVEKVDDHTVRFHLREPDAGLIAALAYNSNPIQSAEYAEAMTKAGTPEKVDLEPVGTGPFQLVQYQPDALIRMRAHKAYWRGAAPIDQLVFAITPDASVRYAKLQAGECHAMSFPNAADLERMRGDPRVKLVSIHAGAVGYVGMNMTVKPFDDLRVRQAMNHAIDKAAIIEQIYFGTAKPATSPIPSVLWAHDPSIADTPYDPARAKALLAEAGYADGFETELWTMPVQRAYNPNPRRLAEMIQADLAKVGVRAKIVSYEWGEYVRRLRFGEAPMAQFGWNATEPDRFLSDLLSCEAAKPGNGNIARWCDPEMDRLITAGRRTLDQEERKAIYVQAQAVFRQHMPWIPMAYPEVFTPLSPRVTGFIPNPNNRMDFYGVGLD